MEYSDFIQESWIVYDKCVKNYGKKERQCTFQSYFYVALRNTVYNFLTKNVLHAPKIVPCDIPELISEQKDDLITHDFIDGIENKRIASALNDIVYVGLSFNTVCKKYHLDKSSARKKFIAEYHRYFD